MKLETNNGTVLDKNSDIIEETESFYRNLYAKGESTDCNINEMVNSLPVLNEDEASDLEGHIDLEEATIALKNMNNNKSPGTGGFTAFGFFSF